MRDGVWLITGVQASGKSTVADLLAKRFEQGVHVRGSQFYRWAVSGWVHFDDRERPSEARRLLDLRYRLSAIVADEYALAGFGVVVQDNIYGDDVVRWLNRVTAEPRHLLVLHPRAEVVAARDEQRRRSMGKVAYRGQFTVAENDAHLVTTPRELGLWLDTSDQSPEQTVTEVLSRRSEARVP